MNALEKACNMNYMTAEFMVGLVLSSIYLINDNNITNE